MTAGQDLKALKGISKDFSAGRRIFNKFFEVQPVDPEGIKRFILKGEITVSPEEKDLLELIIEETDSIGLSEMSQDLTIDMFKEDQYRTLGKKIQRLEKKREKISGEDEKKIDEKVQYIIKKAQTFDEMTDNWWQAQTRKEGQKLWFSTIMGMGAMFNEIKEAQNEQSRQE